MSTRTHRTRLARRVAADTELSYQQALELVTRLSAAGSLPARFDSAGFEASVRIALAHLAAEQAAGGTLAPTSGPLVALADPVELALNLLATAYAWRASDLHFEQCPEAGLTVRGRVEGELLPLQWADQVDDDAAAFDAVMSLLAQHASSTDAGADYIDHAGALPLPPAEVAPFRSSSTQVNGRTILVVRFLPDRVLALNEIGLSVRAMGLVRKQLHRPGLIVASGPTGAGKSTTARAFAGAVHAEVTAMNLAATELRDVATVEAAVAAAEDGALVIASIHSRGAVETARRLLRTADDDLASRLARQLRLITSQHLVPRNCPNGPAGHDTAAPGRQVCACRNTGTLGRTGLFDVLVTDGDSLAGLAGRTAQVSFADSGRDLVERGIASEETVQRYL